MKFASSGVSLTEMAAPSSPLPRTTQFRRVLALCFALLALSLCSTNSAAQIVQIISATPSGSFGGHNSYNLWLNGDGRYAGFVSYAPDLVANPGIAPQLYVRDTCVGSASAGCTPSTSIASLDSGGNPLPFGVQTALQSGVISSSGRYVLFAAEPPDVTGSSSPFVLVLYLRDTCAGADASCVPQSFRADRLDPNAVALTSSSVSDSDGTMSPDGRFALFSTIDHVLTSVPGGSVPQVYLTDNCLGGGVSGCTASTILISSVGGAPSSQGAFYPSVAQGGRYVSFYSSDPALVPGATITQSHYFLRDTCIGASSGCTPSTALIEIGADGVSEAVGIPNSALASQPASFSASGRYVLFNSKARNMVAGVTPPSGIQVYLRDTCSGAPSGCTPSTILVSPTEGPITLSSDSYAGAHSLSDDGRFAVFAGPAAGGNLAIYMRDTCIGAPAGCVPTTKLVSSDPNNIAGSNPTFSQPVISGDGKYVAFTGGGTSFTHFQLFLAKAPEFTISAPAASLSATSLDFGTVQVGQTSAQKQVTLTNSGNSSLNVTNIGITGTAAGEFSKTDDCPSSLAASATCTITVSFAPTAGGSASATLSVADNASDSPQSVTLTGTGVSATQLTVSPASKDFGSLVVGTGQSTATLTFTNPGQVAISISSVTITGSGAASFLVASGSLTPCGTGSVIQPGGSCPVYVSFVPTAAGALSATLSVTDQVGTVTAGLTGTGVATSPKATLDPAAWDFGSQTTGSGSGNHTFTLTNSGNAALPISAVSVSGTGAAAFTATSQCGSSLAAGASCSINVVFAPQTADAFNATLTVTDSLGTQTASLTGTGAAPATPASVTLSVTPSVVDVARGQTAVFTIHVLSQATGNQTINPVTLSVVNPPAGVSITFSPSNLTPGTTAPADSTATVTISSGAVLSSAQSQRPAFPGRTLGGTLALAGLVLLTPLRFRRRVTWLVLVVLIGMGCALSVTACGTDSSGSYKTNMEIQAVQTSAGGASAAAGTGYIVLCHGGACNK